MTTLTFLRRLSIHVAVAITLVGVSAPAALAQAPHRARMSRDLADRLAQGVEAPAEIIVSASDATVDQLVVRYGARLKKRVPGGAVLQATGGQIDAISQDPA
jgi:hypothetical protein